MTPTPPAVDYASPPKPTLSKAARITGWVISILILLWMGVMPIVMLLNLSMVFENMKKYGYPERSVIPLMITEIVCALLYIIPKTATLGAILLTGYLGGAVATHVRADEAFWIPIVFGGLVWLGLLLRSPSLRRLLPLRTEPAA
jgi:hypothetical protein